MRLLVRVEGWTRHKCAAVHLWHSWHSWHSWHLWLRGLRRPDVGAGNGGAGNGGAGSNVEFLLGEAWSEHWGMSLLAGIGHGLHLQGVGKDGSCSARRRRRPAIGCVVVSAELVLHGGCLDAGLGADADHDLDLFSCGASFAELSLDAGPSQCEGRVEGEEGILIWASRASRGQFLRRRGRRLAGLGHCASRAHCLSDCSTTLQRCLWKEGLDHLVSGAHALSCTA